MELESILSLPDDEAHAFNQVPGSELDVTGSH